MTQINDEKEDSDQCSDEDEDNSNNNNNYIKNFGNYPFLLFFS